MDETAIVMGNNKSIAVLSVTLHFVGPDIITITKFWTDSSLLQI